MRPFAVLLLIVLATGTSAATFPVSPPSETGPAPGSRADVRLATTGDTSLGGAFDGGSFVVLTYDPSGRHQWLRRTEHGVRLATRPMLDFADELLTGLALAWNGSAFMVVTRAIRAVDGRATAIHAREYDPRLLPAGAPLTLAEDLRYMDAESPVLAARPGGWLASWWGCDARDCGTDTSTLTGGAPVTIAGAAEPLQLSWNGAAFELLDTHGVVHLDEQGNPAGFHRLTYDARLQAMAHAGARRIYTFLRHDPASGTTRLDAGLADVTEPQRRRSARH